VNRIFVTAAAKRLRTHTNSLIAGLLLILLGGSLVAFQGSSALSGLYDDLGLAELGFRIQTWILDHASSSADALGLVLALLILSGVVARRVQRRGPLRARRDHVAASAASQANAQQAGDTNPLSTTTRSSSR
jgi:hypothetical protein